MKENTALPNIRRWFGGVVKALAFFGVVALAGAAEAKLVHEKEYTITDHWWSDGVLREKKWQYTLTWDLATVEPSLSEYDILHMGKGWPALYDKPFELGIKINGVTPKTTGSYLTTDANGHKAKFYYTAVTTYYSQSQVSNWGYSNGEIGFVDLDTEGAVWRISGKDYSGSVILFARKNCTIILEDGVEIGDNAERNCFSQVSPLVCRADEVTIINEGNATLWGNKYSPAVATIGGICNFASTGDTGWLYAFGGKNAPAIGLMEFHGSDFYDDTGMLVDDFFDLGFGHVSQDSEINVWGRVAAEVSGDSDRGVCAIGIDSMEDYSTRGPLPLTVNICESGNVTAGGAPAIGIAEGRQGRFKLKVQGGSVSAENRTGYAAPAIGSGPNTSCDPASFCDVGICGGKVFAGVYGTVPAPGIGMASETGVDAYVNISGGEVEAVGGVGYCGIGNAWYDGNGRKDVRITGGTVVTEGDQTVARDSRIGIHYGYVTGGSVKVDRKVGKSLTDGSKNLVCITVEGLEARAKVSSLSLPVGNRSYGTTDIYADDNGSIFLWVPAGDYSGKLVVNGVKYDADASEGDVVATREKRYTVKFNACGGSPTPASITRRPGRVIGPNVLNQPTLSGYVFDGWWTDSMYGSRVSALTVVNQSMTCYAHWSKESTTHVEREVKFWVLYQSSEKPYAIYTGIDGTKLGTLPVPAERPGYAFDGWWDWPADDNGSRITESTKFTAALSAYARWTPLKETVNGYTWRYRVIDGKAEICTPQSDYERAVEPAPAAGSVVTVPSTLGGYPVTSIGEDAFFNCSNMTHVVIPDSVRKIGDRAFHGCTRLTEPEGMQNVESIGDQAFYGCKSLGTFTVPGSLKEIADFMFTDCYALQQIAIPDGVERIGTCAFAFCKNLAVVTIPASVTDIGNEAFIGCENLWNLVMPDSPRRIGARAFYKCDSLAISTGFVVVDGILYGYTFNDSSVTLPDGVKFLTSLAFFDYDTDSYKTVTELTMPESVVASFANSQFYKTGLKTVNLTFSDDSADMVSRRDEIKAAIEASGYRSAVTYNLPEVAVTFEGVDYSQTRGARAGEALGPVIGTVADPTRGGDVTFDGWWTQEQGGERVTAATVVRGNVTYYAHWKGVASSAMGIGGSSAASMSRAYSCEAVEDAYFSVSSDGSWTAASNVDWIKLSYAGGNGNGKVKYSLDANEGAQRIGKITVKSGSITCTCKITQDKPLLISGKEAMSRTYDAAKQAGCYFSVTCSQSPWTAVSSASWVTIKSGSASGTGSGKVYYDIAANASSSSRTATVKVTSRSLTRTCTITQKAGAEPTLTIGGGKTSMSRAYSCAAKEGESFSVACNGSWTATPSVSWITVTAGASGSGNGTVKYSLAENMGTSKREGTIKVKCGGLTRTCTITQDKPLLIGGKTSMSRTYAAAKQTGCYFSVTCSQSPWTAVSSASWVTIKSGSASGTGSGKVYYDIAANTSSAKRTATIKVTSRGLTRTCTITQKGASGAAPRAMPMSRARAAAGLPAGLYEGVPADGGEGYSIRGIAYLQDGTVCEMTVSVLSGSMVFAVVGEDVYSGCLDGFGGCELTGNGGTLSVFCIESTPVGFQTRAGCAELGSGSVL